MGADPETEETPQDAAGVLPFFLPLQKLDLRTGEFVATAALEVLDGSNEVFDYATSKPEFLKLANRCLEESGGKKVAPLRLMHDLREGGIVQEFMFDDARRVVGVRGRITDRDALAKADDGTFCGVSMGGKKRYIGYDAANPGARRYTALPVEISLVDLGMIPGTGITMLNAAAPCELVRADGSVAVLDLRKADDAEKPADEAAAETSAAEGEETGHEAAAGSDDPPTDERPEGDLEKALASVATMVAGMAPLEKADALRAMRKRMQLVHDLSCEMGAACVSAEMTNVLTQPASAPAEEDDMNEQDLAKAVRGALGLKDEETLQNAIGGLVTEAVSGKLDEMRNALGGQLEEQGKAVKALEERLAKAEADVQKIGEQPAAPVGALLSLHKGTDGSGGANAIAEEALRKLGERDPAALVKFIQQQPGNGVHLDVNGISPVA